MAGKLQFTPEEFQEAATKYRKELLMLPIIGVQDTLQFMTARPGIRYKENVGALSGDAQFIKTILLDVKRASAMITKAIEDCTIQAAEAA